VGQYIGVFRECKWKIQVFFNFFSAGLPMDRDFIVFLFRCG